MKQRIILFAAFIMSVVLFSGKIGAQTSPDVPHILSYQGQVTTNDGSAMNGTHHITTTLYSDPHGTNSVWHGEYSAEISNGIFNILLGSGTYKLPEVSVMNRPLWVGIKVDGGEEMKPLTQLSAAPYSLNIPDKSVTQAKLSPDVQLAIFGAGHTPKTQNVGGNVLLGGQAFGGGGAAEGDEWIGSNNGYGVWFRTNNTVAMRYLSSSTTPNIIGGYSGNLINTGDGSVIGGGGLSTQINEIRANFGVIAGGKANLIADGSNLGAIVGGVNNTIDTSIIEGFIGGGLLNEIYTGCNSSGIMDGEYNVIQNGGTSGSGKFCSIPGGHYLIAQGYGQSVIGHYNTARGISTPSSINATDPLFIIGNGTATNARSNAFEVRNNGTSIVTNTNGNGNAAVKGGTCLDNIIYAWAYCTVAAGVVTRVANYGVSGVAWNAAGNYTVSLTLADIAGSPILFTGAAGQNAAVVVTPITGGPGCVSASASAIGTVGGVPKFNLYIANAACAGVDKDFMFIVVGRP